MLTLFLYPWVIRQGMDYTKAIGCECRSQLFVTRALTLELLVLVMSNCVHKKKPNIVIMAQMAVALTTATPTPLDTIKQTTLPGSLGCPCFRV